MAISASPPVSLSNLAAEFGGSAPHSLSEYYRGGSYVPDIAANAGVPTSGSISLSDFYGAADGAISLFGGTTSSASVGNATSTIQWFRTGQCTHYSSSPSSVNHPWYEPVGGTPGDSYWIRFTYISGDALTDASGLNTWLQISTTYRYIQLFNTSGTKTNVTRVQLANDSGGSNIIATADYTLVATVT